MNRRTVAAIAACVAIMLLALAPFADATGSSAEVKPGDITVVDSSKASVVSGKSVEVTLWITNMLPPSGDQKGRILVTALPESNSKISVTAVTRDVVLSGGESDKIVLKVFTDRYTGTALYTMKVDLECRSMDTGGEAYRIEHTFTVDVESVVYSGYGYNLILGVFDPLPAPFDKPIITASVTFLLWILIGIVVAIIIAPIIMRILAHGESDKTAPKRGFRRIIVSIILVYALGSSLRVYGAPEEVLETVRSLSYVLYVVIGGALAWKLYLMIMSFIINRMEGEQSIDAKDTEPLIRLAGKAIIAVSGLALILASFGINMAAIVTSAGLVTLGITYGAANVLSHFFSGITILMTRPFKEGDMVRIGGPASADYYRVKKVKVMVTVFDNTLNRDAIVVPNNVVVNSVIVNMTGRGMSYRLDVFTKVPYGTDIDRVRRILLDLGHMHGGTVTDGSVPKPYVNVMDITNAGVDIRLTVHIRDVNLLWDIYAELREKVYRKFTEEGITIPYPHVNIVSGDARDGAI